MFGNLRVKLADVYGHSGYEPESWLPDIAVVDILSRQEIVGLDECVPSRLVPRQPRVDEAICAVGVPVVGCVEIAAHAVLHTEVDAEVEITENIELSLGYELVFQIFERVLADDSFCAPSS